MNILLKDTQAEIVEFSCSKTYSGEMEGTYLSISKVLLEEDCEEMTEGRGFVLLDESGIFDKDKDLGGIRLGDYCFTLTLQTDDNHTLKIKWYDGELDMTKPLKNVLEERVGCVEFFKYCRELNKDGKTPFTLYWEKMGDKRGKIYDMKAVLK